MTPTDRVRVRTVRNLSAQIQEHLEAMQRDVHGLEFEHWKAEVDGLWRRSFGQIERMQVELQRLALEEIRKPWTDYLTYYAGHGH